MAGRTLTIATLAAIASGISGSLAQDATSSSLQPPEAFQSITDKQQRSRAIFSEIGKVLTHPRCMNCHPAGEHPLQGAAREPHDPPVRRGPDNHGRPDSCSTCHAEKNVTLHVGGRLHSIPGHPRWELAPLSMAWEAKSLGEICRQLKDPARNGGRDLALLHEHVAKDDLVAWGWSPGEGREPAPGNQELAGKLVEAWIDNGAECPER